MFPFELELEPPPQIRRRLKATLMTGPPTTYGELTTAPSPSHAEPRYAHRDLRPRSAGAPQAPRLPGPKPAPKGGGFFYYFFAR